MIDLWKYGREIFTPRVDLPVWEWCEQNIQSVPMAEDDGPYSTTLFPFVREPLECFRDRDCEEVILVWGSQTSKTTTLAAGMMWTIENDPVDTMWGMDTGANAEKFSKDRFGKMVEFTPKISARLGGKRGDDNILEKRFDQMSFYLLGSNSPGNLASQPAGKTIGDEIDKWPGANKKESAAVKLLESRTKGKSVFQRFWSSTPTTEEGAIWQKWKTSDQRHYMMPCPCCDMAFKFETKGVIYDSSSKDEEGNYDLEAVKKSAYYLTPCCGYKLNDAEKLKIMREAYDRRVEGFAWTPGNSSRARPRTRGYHLHSLYSPVITFGAFAVEWVLSKSDPVAQQNFTNSWEALPFMDRVIELRPEQIKKVEADYHRGDMVGKVRVMIVDVQRKDLRFNIRGYGPDSRLIDWGTLSTWEDVEQIQSRLNVEHVGVDVQFPDRQQEAFQEIFERRDQGWFALEGKGKGQGLFGKLYNVQRINPFVGERKKLVSSRSKIMYMQINSEAWKGELAKKRNAESPEWKVYKDVESGYIRELYAEFQRKVLRNGRMTTEWAVKSHKQNHQFDLEYYHLAVASFLKLDPYDGGKLAPLFKKAEESKELSRNEKRVDQAPQRTSFFKPVASR